MPEPTLFDVDRDRVEKLLDGAEADGREWLLEPEALQVLEAYGIPVVAHSLATSEDEAVDAADRMEGPVVLKIVSPDVVHKSDVGGVRVNLATSEEVRRAYRGILESVQTAHPSADVHGVLVTRFREGGREIIVGMSNDPGFGPLIMFGLGGVHVEALADVSFRIQPVSEQDAREMVEGIRGRKLLEGVRGESPVDREPLVEVLQRISQLVGEPLRIQELDINPFLALPAGGVAVDVRIRIQGA